MLPQRAPLCRLCEQLLFRQGPNAALLAPDGAANLAETGFSVRHQEKRLLLKYVHVLTDSLQRRQSEVERRLQEIERWLRRRSSGSKSSGTLFDDGGSPRNGATGFGLQMPGWLRHPALVGSCMLLTISVPPDHAANRILKAVPYLALLRTP